jgi:hypothetical protein
MGGLNHANRSFVAVVFKPNGLNFQVFSSSKKHSFLAMFSVILFFKKLENQLFDNKKLSFLAKTKA